MLSSCSRPTIRLSLGFLLIPGNWVRLEDGWSRSHPLNSRCNTYGELKNVVADALSRMFSQPSEAQPDQPCSVLLDFPLAFTDVLPHQLDDEELGQNLKEGNVQAPYFLSKGVLCCKERKGRAPKIVLPSKLVPMVFSYYHNSPVGGHKGISKTISSIRRHFIWKGMDKDIATRVKACHLCGLSKPAQNTKLGLLSSDVASRPMEKLFIDYLGPFPHSKSGNSYLLVCVDVFSKFAWLLPLRPVSYTHLDVYKRQVPRSR